MSHTVNSSHPKRRGGVKWEFAPDFVLDLQGERPTGGAG